MCYPPFYRVLHAHVMILPLLFHLFVSRKKLYILLLSESERHQCSSLYSVSLPLFRSFLSSPSPSLSLRCWWKNGFITVIALFFSFSFFCVCNRVTFLQVNVHPKCEIRGVRRLWMCLNLTCSGGPDWMVRGGPEIIHDQSSIVHPLCGFKQISHPNCDHNVAARSSGSVMAHPRSICSRFARMRH
jgi:hypothetical protein